MIEVGLFILPSFKESVSVEVLEISAMYWTPAKSGLGSILTSWCQDILCFAS